MPRARAAAAPVAPRDEDFEDMSQTDEDRQALGVSRSSSIPAPMDDVRATREPLKRTSEQARAAGIQVYDPFPSEPHDDEDAMAQGPGEEA
jgi:hypothetical protein